MGGEGKHACDGECVSVFDLVSPTAFRYRDPDVERYLSEEAFTRAKARVELAVVTVMARRGMCPPETISAVEIAIDKTRAVAVYEREKKTRHDIVALREEMRSHAPEHLRRYFHMFATSYDKVEPARIKMFHDVTDKVVLLELERLIRVVAGIVVREAETRQVGRSHGQHGSPITFGFAMAWHLARLHNCYDRIQTIMGELIAKFSGAMGAYNASSLLMSDPQRFEGEVLQELGLDPGLISTQIVMPEPLADLHHAFVMTAMALANLARDMRCLQRTEIDEVQEEFVDGQSGSSAMPHKRNPIGWENIESMAKIILSRATLPLLDMISEHNRDLTGSASGRTYGETVQYLVYMIKRATRSLEKLWVNRDKMKANLHLTGMVNSEAMQVLLGKYEHPNAHTRVLELTKKANKTDNLLYVQLFLEDDLKPYLDKMTEEERRILADPELYIGRANEQALHVAQVVASKLNFQL